MERETGLNPIFETGEERLSELSEANFVNRLTASQPTTFGFTNSFMQQIELEPLRKADENVESQLQPLGTEVRNVDLDGA